MKTRQTLFRQTGSSAYTKAQRLAFALRSAGFEADQGCIESSLGTWNDTIYIMSNAPLATIRRLARAEDLTPTWKGQ